MSNVIIPKRQPISISSKEIMDKISSGELKPVFGTINGSASLYLVPQPPLSDASTINVKFPALKVSELVHAPEGFFDRSQANGSECIHAPEYLVHNESPRADATSDRENKIDPDDILNEEPAVVEILAQKISEMNKNGRIYDAAVMSTVIDEMYESQKNQGMMLDEIIPSRFIPAINPDYGNAMKAFKLICENNGNCISQPDTKCICDTFIQTGYCACGVFKMVTATASGNICESTSSESGMSYRYHPFMPHVQTHAFEKEE